MKYKLGDICEIVSGSTPKTSVEAYWDGDVKWITPAELTDESYIIHDSARKLTELGVKKTGLTPFPAGTVILSSRAPIGKVAIAGCEMYCNQGFKNLICSEKINNKYLYWFLKGNTAFLNSLGRGATFKEISKGIVSDIEINVPDLADQIKAVCNLEKLSEIIKLRKKQLRELDDLIKARFVEMFGDLLVNPKGYKKERLDKHAEVLVGYPFKSEEYTESGIRIVGGYNLMQGFIEWEQCKFWPDVEGYEQYLLHDGDIVMAMDRPWVNGGFKLARIDREHLPALLIQRTACIRGKDIEQEFLYELLNSNWFAAHCNITGSLVPHISNKDINSFEIILPPEAERKAYVGFVQQVDKSKVAE